jgi:hypothetical protein
MSPTVKERRAVVITLTSCCMSNGFRTRRLKFDSADSDVLLKLANGDIETVEVCLFEDWEGTLFDSSLSGKNNEWSLRLNTVFMANIQSDFRVFVFCKLNSQKLK